MLHIEIIGDVDNGLMCFFSDILLTWGVTGTEAGKHQGPDGSGFDMDTAY